MKRVAVFGNAGGGKSTLARRLSELTGLPLHVIDKILFPNGKDRLSSDEYAETHADLVAQDRWIIDGYGGRASAWERFARADTLVYVDLPLLTHWWWVTKRLFGGLFSTPKGWPVGAPLWSSTLSSYKVLWLCHRRLTPKYRSYVADAAHAKRVVHLRSRSDIAAFLADVARQQQRT